MVGRSDDKPVEFHRLPLRTGVDVVTGSKELTNTYKLRLSELNMGEGAVCEHGVVLVDSAVSEHLMQTAEWSACCRCRALATRFAQPSAGTS
jgi:hypothetical protein